MLNFPLALLSLFLIFQFSLAAGFDAAVAAVAAAAAGGGGGGEEDIASSVLLLPPPDNDDDGSKGSLNGLSGASISADDWPEDDLLTTNPSIRYADASPQSQKHPSSENNNNHACRADDLGPNNSNMMQRKKVRDVKNGFCANDILPLLTTEQQQQQQQQKKKQQPEGLFGGRGGGGRRGPGPIRPDAGQDGGDPLIKDDAHDANAAALFSPAENPNICKDPSHPIPVCHKLVQSFSGDLDDVLFELPRCYPC